VHQLMTPVDKEGRALRAPAGTNQQKPSYVSPRPPSRQISAESDGTALGLLLWALQATVLPRAVQRRGWLLAEKWAGEYIAAKHMEAA